MRTLKDCSRLALCLVILLTTACGGGSDGTSNHAPVANAGSAQTAIKRSQVTLDGTASHDADGNSLTFNWTQTSGTSVVLSDPHSSKPTFTSPGTAGALVFSLVVNDGTSDSSSSSVSVAIANTAPIAVAGANSTVAAGAAVTLDGTGSSDADHDALSYSWTQSGGPGVTLDTSQQGFATFVAPNAATTLQFSLLVNDGEANSTVSTVTIAVLAPGVVPPPVANAGPDQDSPRRAVVALHGSGTDQSGGYLTYAWHQTGGISVTLQNAGSPTPQFTAPDTAGDLQFALVVSNGTASSATSLTSVHVKNYAPQIYSLTLTPANPKRNDAISATAATIDSDADVVTLAYVWKRNGTILGGATTATYPSGNQVKGDVISVVVTASDGSLTTTASTNVAILDSPPVLSGTPSTVAAYGQPVSFQLSATDIDGDPTTFEVEYAPAGFSVSAAGLVTWTPSGALFERSTDMAWRVRLHDSPQIHMDGTITVQDSARQYPLARSDSALPTYSAAIDVQDLDGTGAQSILVGTQKSLYVLGKSGADYAQTWMYPYSPVGDATSVTTGADISFRAVTSGDVDGDGHREIFFSQGPYVIELDGVTRREVARYGDGGSATTPALGPYCRSLRYADIDNDGKGEVVCLGASALYQAPTYIYVLDAKTLTLKWQTGPLTTASTMAIGNVDGDPALEIVTSDGFVFDGATHQNEWAYGPGFGSEIDIGDVNGDGVGKIVAVDSTGNLRAFDAVTKSALWSIPGSVSLKQLRVSDLDGVAPAEIIATDNFTGNVSIYRYNSSSQTPQLVTQTAVTPYGISALAVGDVDGDGTPDLIWGGASSIGAGSFVVAAWNPSIAIKWTGPTAASLDGPFIGAKLASIGSGTSRLLFATPSTNSAYAGERLIALDPMTGALTLSNEVDTNWSRDRAFDVARPYSSGVDSVLLGTAAIYDGYFAVYDFASNSKQYTSAKLGDFVALTHADLNHDGYPDAIGIATNGLIYAVDVHNQTLLWSGTGTGYGADIVAADLDGDGDPEIIALSSTAVQIYKHDIAHGGYALQGSAAIGGTDLLVADTDGDGSPEIFVLNSNTYQGDGSITKLSSTLQTQATYAVPYATSFYLEESTFARKNLVVSFGTPNYVSLMGSLAVIDAKSGATIWTSPHLSGTVPINSLSFVDTNGDGQLQMAFGTSSGMYLTR